MNSQTSTKKLVVVMLLFALVLFSCQTITRGLNQLTEFGTQPQETLSVPPPQNANPSHITPTATPTLIPIDQDLQFDVFQSLWEAVDQNYLYPDFNGLDWDAVYDEYHQRIEAGMDTEAFYLAMDEMVYALGDEHSTFLNPRQVEAEEAEYSGGHDYVGIGVWIQYLPEKQRGVILLTFPGGPADLAGIKSHDSILSVEGIPLDDEEGKALDLLLGIKGTPVTFSVQTPGDPPRTMTVSRGRIASSLPVPYEVLQTPGGQRIGYIIIPSFSDSTIGDQVGKALASMTIDGPLDGVILDNRLNGGGWNTVMSSTLSYFTNGKVGDYINREGREALDLPRKNVSGSAELPLVVLIGKETASFGEIFAGILKDQERATLIGETTDGNVEILWGYDFDDGSRAWIAHDTFEPENHPEWDWEHDGIVVDIEVPADWDEYTTQTDPAIQAALDHLDR